MNLGSSATNLCRDLTALITTVMVRVTCLIRGEERKVSAEIAQGEKLETILHALKTDDAVNVLVVLGEFHVSVVGGVSVCLTLFVSYMTLT